MYQVIKIEGKSRSRMLKTPVSAAEALFYAELLDALTESEGIDYVIRRLDES